MPATWTVAYEDAREPVRGLADFYECLDVIQADQNCGEVDWRKPIDRDCAASWEFVNASTKKVVAKLYFEWD